MANSEGFSFPTLASQVAPSSSIGSPPLWNRHSARAQLQETERRNREDQDDEEHKPIKDYLLTRSLSCLEFEEEEKMDVLWEDFNEELSKLCGSEREFETSPSGKAVDLGGVKALPLSKASSGFPGKKLSIEVLMRFLKKMFLVRDSKRVVKRKL